MNLEIQLWQLVCLLLAFFSAVGAVSKLLLGQTLKHLDARFSSQEQIRMAEHSQISERLNRIEAASREESARWLQVERELHKLQIELPREYVRREDYVMAVASIMAKLDGISMKFENLILRGAKNYE